MKSSFTLKKVGALNQQIHGAFTMTTKSMFDLWHGRLTLLTQTREAISKSSNISKSIQKAVLLQNGDLCEYAIPYESFDKSSSYHKQLLRV